MTTDAPPEQYLDLRRLRSAIRRGSRRHPEEPAAAPTTVEAEQNVALLRARIDALEAKLAQANERADKRLLEWTARRGPVTPLRTRPAVDADLRRTVRYELRPRDELGRAAMGRARAGSF